MTSRSLRSIGSQLAARLRRPSRYAQVGLFCALSVNACVIVFDQMGMHYLSATLASTAIVTVAGFLLHCAYTYKVTPTWSGFGRFASTIAAGSVMSVILMVGLCDGIGLSASQAMPIATIAMFCWNYLSATWALARAAR